MSTEEAWFEAQITNNLFPVRIDLFDDTQALVATAEDSLFPRILSPGVYFLALGTDGFIPAAGFDYTLRAAIPEPTTALLLAGGLAGLGAARRRRQ